MVSNGRFIGPELGDKAQTGDISTPTNNRVSVRRDQFYAGYSIVRANAKHLA